jgi:hypothetical protein
MVEEVCMFTWGKYRSVFMNNLLFIKKTALAGLIAFYVSGCFCFERTVEVEVYRPFQKTAYSYYRINLESNLSCWMSNILDENGLIDSFCEKKPVSDQQLLRIVIQSDRGFIFPPVFFHNIFDPIFIAAKRYDICFFDGSGLTCLAKANGCRGIFRSEITSNELENAIKTVLNSNGSVGSLAP